MNRDTMVMLGIVPWYGIPDDDLSGQKGQGRMVYDMLLHPRHFNTHEPGCATPPRLVHHDMLSNDYRRDGPTFVSFLRVGVHDTFHM